MGQGKGGGPKTAAGKARSSRNAVRHGVTALADPMVLPTESEEEWLAFRDSIVADIGPTGAVQEEIARYVAECMWTRRRLRVMENASVQGEMRAWLGHLRVLRTMDHTENPKDITPDHKARYEEQKGRWMRKSVIPDESDLAKIIKYDSHLTRQINRALWELRLLKREQEGREPGSAWLEVRGGNVDGSWMMSRTRGGSGCGSG